MRRLPLFGVIVIGLVAAAVLSGCRTPVERAAKREVWNVDADRGEGRLVLAAPNADDARVLMTCPPHSGHVDITLMVRKTDPAVVELHSGKVWGRYAGAGHEDEMTPDGFDINLTLPASEPVLTQLGAKGDLFIVLGKRRIVLPNAFSPAHDFLAICRLP